MTKALTLPRLLGACGLALLIFLLHLPATRDAILFDDAADYMRAAHSPLLHTYLNTDSAAPWELMKLRRTDEGFRQRPWDALYAMGDNAALRHFHSPVSYYPMHIVRALASSDRSMRLLVNVVSALLCGLMFFALTEFQVPLAVAAWLVLFAGVGSRFVEPSVDPTPHIWFMLFAMAFLYAFSRFLQSRRTSDLYATAVALAVCFATLEFTVELIASIPCALAAAWFCGKLEGMRWKDWAGPLLRAFGVFLLSTFVLWPGGWLRAGYAETYGVLSATVLFKNKSAFGEHLTAGLIYRVVFAGHPVLLVLTLAWVIGGTWLLVQRRMSVPAIVFSAYTMFAFVLGVADHFRLSTYVSEFVVFLIASSGLVLESALTPAAEPGGAVPRSFAWRPCVYIALVVALLVGSFVEWNHRWALWGFRPWLAQVFQDVQADVPAGQALLVNNNRESLSLHLPNYRFEPTASPADPEPRTPSRAEGIRYGLFDPPLTAPLNAHVLASVNETSTRADVLWQK